MRTIPDAALIPLLPPGDPDRIAAEVDWSALAPPLDPVAGRSIPSHVDFDPRRYDMPAGYCGFAGMSAAEMEGRE